MLHSPVCSSRLVSGRLTVSIAQLIILDIHSLKCVNHNNFFGILKTVSPVLIFYKTHPNSALKYQFVA